MQGLESGGYGPTVATPRAGMGKVQSLITSPSNKIKILNKQHNYLLALPLPNLFLRSTLAKLTKTYFFFPIGSLIPLDKEEFFSISRQKRLQKRVSWEMQGLKPSRGEGPPVALEGEGKGGGEKRKTN